ncbi:MAG: hypothetical protein ABI851_16155 [Saprospiraceae bacterium]
MVILFCNLVPIWGISQKIGLADMMLESKLHKRWLNCKSTELDLLAENPTQPNKCYKWSERAYGTSAYIEIAHNTAEMGIQKVKPDKTYWYKCERFNNGQCSGPVDMVWYFKVYVVEEVHLISLVLNGESVYDLNSGVNPSVPPETMDEYNDYLLQGNFTIGDILELPKDLSMLPVSLHYSTNIGQSIPDLNPSIEDWALKKDGLIPQVQQDGIHKEYILTITAECCGIISNEFKVLVKRLWIEKFSHPTINSASKWLVVVNDPVNCEASAANTIHHFEWYPYYKGWTFEDNISNSPIWNNLKFKPKNGKMPESNSDFGSKFGTILLKCSDKNGNVMGVMSSKEIKNTISSEPFNMFDKWRPMNSSKAKVFFHKNDEILDNIPSLKSPPPGVPASVFKPKLWLFYWRDIVKKSNYIKVVRYDEETDPDYLANTPRPRRESFTFPVFSNQSTFVVNKVANVPINVKTTIKYLEGIEAFYSVINHESWHADFINDVHWKNGYVPNKDLEIILIAKKIQQYAGDFYNDEWEDMNPPFSSLKDDYYDPNETTIGGKYEEMFANGRVKILEEGGLFKSLNNQDWSYDKFMNTQGYKGNQGKQWNK